MTHTYALLPVSESTYTEIYDALKAAGYDHLIMDDGSICMTSIAIELTSDSAPHPGTHDRIISKLLP